MGLVVVVLNPPAALCLVHGGAHTAGYGVGVEDDHALGVSGGTADGLDEAGFAAEEALLVGVQNGHQTHLRHVQALPQEVDAHQHVKLPQPEVPDQLHPLDGLHVVVHIPHPDAGLLQILCQILRHFFRQGRDQHPLVSGGAGVDLPNEVVDLPLYGPHLHPGVQQPRGPDHLLHNLVRLAPLVVRRGGGDIHRLAEPGLELIKFQGTVVEGAGEPEAVLHKALLPGPVPVVHGPDLGQRHMALIHKEDKVVGEIVHQGQRRGAHRPAGDHPAVVLDAGAVAQFPHHLHIVGGALADALGLDQFALLRKPGLPLIQFLLDLPDGPVHLLLAGDIVAGGPDGNGVQPAGHGAGDRVDFTEPVDLVSEELHPDGAVLPVGGPEFHRVAPDPEHVPLKRDVVAFVADLHQAVEQLVPLHLGPRPQGDHHLLKVLRLPQAVDAADGGHHDDVPPLQKRGGGRQAQPVDLLVDRGILLNEGVGVGNIGLRLIVVVVGDKVFHRIVGEKLLELLAQLGCQGLVVCQHQGGPLDSLDDLGHGVGLAGACDPQQHLLPQAVLNSPCQGGNGLGLVAGGGVFGNYFEFRHGSISRKSKMSDSGGQPRRRCAAQAFCRRQNLGARSDLLAPRKCYKPGPLKNPAKRFLWGIAGGGVPRPGAGPFFCGEKGTKKPPEPLRFRPSRLDRGSYGRSEGDMRFGSVIPPPGSGRAPTAPAGLQPDRPCWSQSLPLTEIVAMVRCSAGGPVNGTAVHHRRVVSSVFASGFASQGNMVYRVAGRQAE